MKKVNIREGQLRRLMETLMESDVTNGTFGKSNVSDIGSGEVTTSPTMTDKDGDKEYSDPTTSDGMADTMSPQQWGTVRGRQSTAAI